MLKALHDGAGIYCLQAAIFVEVLGFRFFRYYPFRRSLRLPVQNLVFLMLALAFAEAYIAAHLPSAEQAHFFTRYSEIYLAFTLFYFAFSFAVIRAGFARQLFLWLPIAAWEVTMAGIGFYLERHFQAAMGLPPWLLYLCSLLLGLLVLTPLALKFLRRIEPYLYRKDPMAARLWRWAWVPGLMIFGINLFYTPIITHHLSSIAISRAWGFLGTVGYMHICLLMLETWHRQTLLRQKVRLETDTTRIMRERREYAADAAEQSAIIRHGIRAWLQALEQCADRHDGNGAASLLQQEESRLSSVAMPEHYSEQDLLDAVLRYSLGAAAKHGIRTEVKVQPDAKAALSDTDLCALFGNMLENAIAGCRTLPLPGRWLSLRLLAMGGNMIVTLDNSCDPATVHESDGVFYSEEDGHLMPGTGTASMNEIVRRAGGKLELKHANGVFSVSLLLPMEEEEW